MTERSAVRIPSGVRPPFDVYINGVPQQQGTDYEIRDGMLVFQRELAQEGKLGFWRWTLGAIGIGTYRKHHSVDIRYTTSDGRPQVAQNLPPEPAPARRTA
jgi:hypothetical protein